MTDSDSTQMLPAPTWSDPRIHLLDDTWLLTIFAVLLGTLIPWLVSGLDIRFIAVALGLLALGAIHTALTAIGKPAREGRRRPILAVLHVLGIVIVAFIWLHAGGLQNPAFLMLFALPVVGAIFLSRWQPYLMALITVMVVGVVALVQAPELRWYAPGFAAAAAWIAEVLGQPGIATAAPFPGFYAPSGYFVVLVEIFAIVVFACAVAAEYLGTIFERLYSHVDVARADAERSREFWTTLIEELPAPALLVDADTLHVVCASKEAGPYCQTQPASGRRMFEAIRFSYPDAIHELITGVDGVAPLTMIHIGDRVRAAAVRVQHLAQKGRRYALVAIDDKTDEFTALAALDVAGQATLVIDSRARLLAFNQPARALFATIQKEADADRLLSVAGMPARWWEPGLSGRRKLHIEIGPRIYQVTCSASPLPGEEDRLYVVSFLPVSRAAVADQSAATGARQAADTRRASASNSRLVSPP